MNNNKFLKELTNSVVNAIIGNFSVVNPIIGNYSPNIKPSTPKKNINGNNTIRLNESGEIINIYNNNGNPINNKIATNIVEYYSGQPVKNQKKTKRIEFLDIIREIRTNNVYEIGEELRKTYGNNSNIYTEYLRLINKLIRNEATRNEVANYVYGVTNFLEKKEIKKEKKNKISPYR